MIGSTLRSSALAVLACLLVAVSVLGGTRFSSALYTSQSANAASTASAAVDWTPPAVSVVNPGTALKGAVTISASATDAETGIASVVLQVQATGASTWTTLGTVATAPYSVSWNTTTTADGSYDLRAIATDRSGYSTTSATVRTSVSNAFGVVLADPGDILRGSVSLRATLLNANLLGLYNVRVEYSPAGANRWTLVSGCLSLLGSANCSVTWSTTSLAGGAYDLRAVASPVLNPQAVVYSPILSDVTVDNIAPTASMIDPGSPLSGTVTLAASASDADSGIATVAIQYAPSGSSTWTTACTLTDAPYSCRFSTTALPRGTYAFRAIATDGAGNTTTSAGVTNRQVDNTISSVSLSDPGAYLSGRESLSIDASSTAGITSVTVQYAPTGTSNWTTIGVATQAPYALEWDTTALPDGSYDLRSVLIDGTGRVTISATVSGRRVDNTPIRGADIQTANTTGVAGLVDAGDTVAFTYSRQLQTGSVLRGWDGSATPVTLRLRDGSLLGAGSTGDTLDVLSGSSPVNLGSVNLRGDYIKAGKTATFSATMTARTTTLNGIPATVVTVTIGAQAGGGSGLLHVVTAPGAMIWSPSAGATDLTGTPCSTAPVTETGAADREF